MSNIIYGFSRLFKFIARLFVTFMPNRIAYKVSHYLWTEFVLSHPHYSIDVWHQPARTLDKQTFDTNTLTAMNHPQSGLLAILPKSGSHWVQIFLSHYLEFLNNPDFVPQPDFIQLKESVFRNNREYILGGLDQPKAPTHLFNGLPLNDILHQHLYFNNVERIKYFMGKRLFLFRNPIDQLVSYVNYNHKRGRTKGFLSPHPKHFISYYFSRYSFIYKTVKRLMDPQRDTLLYYADLKRNGAETFKEILTLFNIPIDDTLVEKALFYSDAKRIRNIEKSTDFKINEGYDISHVQDGRVGSWKDYLSQEYAEKMLKKYDIPIGNFIIE